MLKTVNIVFLSLVIVLLSACSTEDQNDESVTVWLIGDSTMANYALEEDYMTRRHPISGWGQVFQPFMVSDSLKLIKRLVPADSVRVDDRAKGGRSTRTFFQEGRWRNVYEQLEAGDLVLIQFGHNDAALSKPERYVNIEGYQEFLRLYVEQSRQKGAMPILLTPVARNYPWKNNQLQNVHGAYPEAMMDVAEELDVLLIDLNRLSMDHFTQMGREYVKENYFMNLPAGVYEAYPDGQKDNTHFQPEGALAVAQLVFNGMKALNNKKEN